MKTVLSCLNFILKYFFTFLFFWKYKHFAAYALSQSSSRFVCLDTWKLFNALGLTFATNPDASKMTRISTNPRIGPPGLGQLSLLLQLNAIDIIVFDYIFLDVPVDGWPLALGWWWAWKIWTFAAFEQTCFRVSSCSLNLLIWWERSSEKRLSTILDYFAFHCPVDHL